MRKLASIQTVKYTRPIPDADNIETIGVLGWECVSKKNEFKEGDKCVYFEIDSLLPEIPEFEFLRKSCWNPTFNKFRLKTVKLRKQLSQGLALPLSMFPDLDLEVGTDVTELLGVEKYEPPIPAQIAGDVRSFAWPVGKTDETRVQLDDEYKFIEKLTGRPYYISLKLDGTSSTFLIDQDDVYHVCGRNYSYKEDPNHSFWIISQRHNIEEGLRQLKDEGTHVAIQGEVCGPGIQKNPLGLKNVELFVFNVVDMKSNRRICLDDAIEITSKLGLKFVPLIEQGDSFAYNQHELLEEAKGKYFDRFETAKPSQDIEGIVIRSTCGEISFKAINNDFLLKE